MYLLHANLLLFYINLYHNIQQFVTRHYYNNHTAQKH